MKRIALSVFFILNILLIGAFCVQAAQPPEVIERLKDMSATIKFLEKTGQLVRVKTEVDPNLELAGIAKKFEGQQKVVLFEKVKGSAYPVVVGFLWNRDLVASVFNTTKDKVVFDIGTAVGSWKKSPMGTDTVRSGPANEVIKKGKDVNLYELPAPVHAEKDGGRYLDCSVIIANDPDTGIPNAHIARLMITAKDRMTLLIDHGRHIEDYVMRAEKAGKPVQITINNGVALGPWLASTFPRGAAPGDKMNLASSMVGEKIRLLKAQTVDTFGLADSQFVIEAEILPNIREPEGPFGEVTGYYAEKDNRYVVKVKAITHRKNAIFHTLLGGKEVYNAVGLTAEAKVFMNVSGLVPAVKAVNFTHGGGAFYHAVVQLKNAKDRVGYREGFSKNVIMATFAAWPTLKQVVVVDDDVDIFNAEDVEWAIAGRCDFEKDLIFIKEGYGHELSPVTNNNLVTKLGIDATAPYPWKQKYDRVTFKEVNLNKYNIEGRDK